MDILSKMSKNTRDRNLGHQKYISRITKTLYYGKFPKPCVLSLPVTELAAELFSEAQRGRSLDRLHCNTAANISKNACVSPCSLVIAILYLERLKKTCPKYLERTASSDIFLVSLMVSSKFLYDDGEADEVFINEWALSAGLTVKALVELERDFLRAIDWEVYVSDLSFWKKLSEIEQTLAKRQGASRGFFTYTELQTLLRLDLQNILQNIFSIYTILISSYTMALLALFGSVFIINCLPGAYVQPKKFEVNRNDSLPSMIYESSSNRESNAINCGLRNNDSIAYEVASLNTEKEAKKNDLQFISWDWWSIPTLHWLPTTCILTEQTEEISRLDFLHQNYKTNVQNDFLDLHVENKISWGHTEWTDIITHEFYSNYLRYRMDN